MSSGTSPAQVLAGPLPGRPVQPRRWQRRRPDHRHRLRGARLPDPGRQARHGLRRRVLGHQHHHRLRAGGRSGWPLGMRMSSMPRQLARTFAASRTRQECVLGLKRAHWHRKWLIEDPVRRPIPSGSAALRHCRELGRARSLWKQASGSDSIPLQHAESCLRCAQVKKACRPRLYDIPACILHGPGDGKQGTALNPGLRAGLLAMPSWDEFCVDFAR